jgi:GMP synthase-like glutamine amidotransferase
MADKVKTGGTSDWAVATYPKVMEGLNKVFVLPGAFYREICFMFAQAGYIRANSVEECDMVVFAGGADIDPGLYGQKPIPETSFNKSRDVYEIAMYHKARSLKKTCVGICRGAQFLAAMNKCGLWQHVDNHGGRNHSIVDIEWDCRVEATSIHHQMIMMNDKMELVAVCEDQVASVFKSENLFVDLNRPGANALCEVEVEAGAFPETRCFFVQGHPEIGSQEYKTWFFSRLKDYHEDWATMPDADEVEVQQQQTPDMLFRMLS